MKQELEFKIGSDGTIETIYHDGLEKLADAMGADVAQVCRASNVEWEEVSNPRSTRHLKGRGWTVRSAKNPELALRICSTGYGAAWVDEIICSKDSVYTIATFATRERAIEWEILYFWQLLDKERPFNG